MNGAVKTEQVCITPSMAALWLERNTRNRRVNKKRVSVYAAEMARGGWLNHHQGIAFYDDGTLADGQHRLAAIVESGVSVLMIVARGLSRESGLMIDAHQQRQGYQSIKISGLSDWIGKDEIAVIKMMNQIQNGQGNSFNLSLMQCVDYGERHKDAISFSVTRLSPKRRGITTAPVRAALSCAFYYEDHDRLSEFCEIMISGMASKDQDRAAIMIREYLIGAIRSGTDGKARDDSCKRVMRAVKAFCCFEAIGKLYQPQHYIYKPIENQEATA